MVEFTKELELSLKMYLQTPAKKPIKGLYLSTIPTTKKTLHSKVKEAHLEFLKFSESEAAAAMHHCYQEQLHLEKVIPRSQAFIVQIQQTTHPGMIQNSLSPS